MTRFHPSLSFALIHSPLTGPEIWLPVAERLIARGQAVVVPDLQDSTESTAENWWQHADSAASAIAAAHPKSLRDPLVLVAHSGAGQLLGSIGRRLTHETAAYLFVDAGLPPRQPSSRLDAIRDEGGDWSDAFEQYLVGGGLFPAWTGAELKDILPDAATRQMVLDTLRPRGLGYFSEQLEATRGAEVLPGGYLQFTPTYTVYASKAADWGWPVKAVEGGHFHMLVEPDAVANAIVALAQMVVRGATIA